MNSGALLFFLVLKPLSAESHVIMDQATQVVLDTPKVSCVSHFLAQIQISKKVSFTAMVLLRNILCLAHSFASYDAKNEYRGDQNLGRKLSTVDGNVNFRPLPFP